MSFIFISYLKGGGQASFMRTTLNKIVKDGVKDRHLTTKLTMLKLIWYVAELKKNVK